MKRRIFATMLLAAGSLGTNAQDIHFTQVFQTPMITNPAATGVFNGWERISANHKNQWVNSGTKFFTSSLAADLNFFKPKRGNKAHLGLGIQLYNDIGGDSKFGTKQLLFNTSGIVPIGENQQISAGIQFGLGQRTGDLSGLLFSNQFNGETLDPTINPQEYNNLVSFMYADLGAGILYRFGNHEVGLTRDDAVDFQVGFSYYHINTPQLNYRIGYTEQLYGKWIAHASFLKDFNDSPVGVQAFFYQFVQGPHLETLYGGLLRYRLKSGAKTTGLTRDAYLNVGFAHRLGDAFAPMLQFQMASFNFGVSYDITLSEFGQVSRQGGLEFSLVYANLDFALFKRR